MKVLEPGQPHRWTLETQCTGKGNKRPGCGARLLLEEGDLFETSSSALWETTYYTTFECPQCKAWTDVPSNVVPAYVQIRKDKTP